MCLQSGATVCYLFDCGTPSVCSFSTTSGYSVVQLHARNSHNTVSNPLNGHKYITKFGHGSSTFQSTTTTSFQSTTTTSVINSSTHKTGESLLSYVE